MRLHISKDMFSLNRGMVLIKIVVFIQVFGTRMIMPYLTLQMRSIGLSFADIGTINGLIPFFIFWSSSVSGFVGDKIGYRVVHIFNLLVVAASSACFDLTPRYHEYTRIPTATIFPSSDNLTVYKLHSVQWPLCDGYTNITSCGESDAFLNDFADIGQYLSCINNTDFLFENEFTLSTPDVTENANGTFCLANTNTGDTNVADYQICNIIGYPGLPTCTDKVGSHATTLWVYFTLRVIYTWCVNSAFAITDATGLKLASIHGSDYSYIQMFSQLAQFICPFVAGALIQDAVAGSGEETNYNMAIYVGDGFLLGAAVLALKLNVDMQKSGQKTLKSLKKLFSIPALNLFAFCFLTGFQFGIRESFLFVYLNEEMNASSQLISYMLSTGALSGLLATFVAKQIIQKVGNVNIIVVATWVEAARFFTYAYVVEMPPYYGIALHALDAFVFTIPWIAAMSYGFKIAPPDLIATMAAAVASCHFIIGKGVGGFIGGQVLGKTNWEAPELFQATGVFCVSCSTILLLLYHCVLKNNHEKVLLEKKAALLDKMKVAKEIAVTEVEINSVRDNSNKNNINSNDNNINNKDNNIKSNSNSSDNDNNINNSDSNDDSNSDVVSDTWRSHLQTD